MSFFVAGQERSGNNDNGHASKLMFKESARMRQSLLSIILLSAAVQGLHAQELSLLDGGIKISETSERSFALALDYQHRLGNHAALGVSYLNEGHPDNHHRDGVSTQLWARTSALTPALTLATGIGPYYYFDTTSVDATNHINRHGWGTLYSLAATWQTQTPWFVQLRANRIHARNSFGTTSLLLGVGYRLDAQASDKPATGASAYGAELTLYAGQTIANNFNSERSKATSIEYRHALSPRIDWTVAWLNEGDPHQERRDGLATQLWMVRPFFNERMRLGVGLGPYFTITNSDKGSSSTEGERRRLAGLLSLTTGYRLSPAWRLRLSFNRVITDHDRDTDVILLGAGYSF
jgi:hypothetical protein